MGLRQKMRFDIDLSEGEKQQLISLVHRHPDWGINAQMENPKKGYSEVERRYIIREAIKNIIHGALENG